MRPTSLHFLCLLSSIVVLSRANSLPGTDEEMPVNVTGLKALPEVFGHLDVNAVRDMIKSRARRTRAAKAYAPERGAHRTVDNCDFPLDLHILQDATGSFAQDFRLAAEVIVPKLEPLLLSHPGSTVSLSMFRDKPLLNLGDPSDYCLRPLAIRTQNLQQVAKLYDNEISSGGCDWTENQYGAIIEILQSPTKIPWMTNADATKLIVLITDAPPHFAGDGYDAEYPDLKPWTGFDENKSDELCSGHYYPTPEQVAAAIQAAGVQLGIIILRPDEYEGRAFAAWEWFNGYIGQHEDFLGVGGDDFDTNWVDRLIELVETVRQEECGSDVPPLPPTPPNCERPQDDRCDECLTNIGCCDKLQMPEVLIAHHNPPVEVDWTIKFPNVTLPTA